MSFFQNLNKKTTNTTPPPASEPVVQSVKPPDAPPSDPKKAADPVEDFTPVPPPKTGRKMLIVDVKPEEKAEDKTAADYSKALKEEIDRAVQREKDQKSNEVETKVVTDNGGGEIRRGRGRPPGAKNKPKDLTLKQAGVDGKKYTQEEIDEEMKRQEEGNHNYQEEGENYLRDLRKLGRGRSFESITVSLGATINVGNFNSVRFDVSVTSKEHTYEEIYEEVKRRLDAEAAKYESEIDKNNKVNAKGVVSK